MRFRRIVIQNFRSIAKADIRLGEITTIVGPSDSGKSNVVRALQSWASNPSGVDMHTVGSIVTRVAVAIDQQHKVIWERAETDDLGGRARYVHADKGRNGGQPISYEKIGRTCPQEIVRVTGISAIGFDDSLSLWLNFAAQDDPWFLMGDAWGPTRVARVIGKVSGIDALIMALKDTKRLKSLAQDALKKSEDAQEDLAKKLGKLSWLDGASAALERVVAPLKSLETDEARLNEAEETLRRVGELRAKQKKAQAFVRPAREALKAIDALDIVADMDRLEAAEAEWVQVTKLQKVALANTSTVADLVKTIAELEKSLDELAGDDELTCPLCGLPAHAECRRELKRRKR